MNSHLHLPSLDELRSRAERRAWLELRTLAEHASLADVPFIADLDLVAAARPGAERLRKRAGTRLREAFAAENLDVRTLWYLAGEGLAGWIRYVETALGEHLDDRPHARRIFQEAMVELARRRVPQFPPLLAQALAVADPMETRAYFEALYPGPLGRAIRWSLERISSRPPSRASRLRGLRRVMSLDARERWLEVSHHLGELTIVLSELLPQHKVPRYAGWFGDVCQAFGREAAELSVSLFDLPLTTGAAIETLRMGELLFRVNPEHTSGAEGPHGSGFIEGNACLWHSRPGWGPIHCGVLGRFQAGVSEVFGLRYSLTRTIPKNGGNVCRITLTPLPEHVNEGHSGPQTAASVPGWQPPSRFIGREEREAMLEKLARGRDPLVGFFGPDTLFWELTRESTVLFLGGGRAALMQLAHPAVAHAIRDHSVVYNDMLGRFMRTMSSAYGALFGSVEEALSISRRVFEVHSAISGTLDDVPGHAHGRYRALDPEATFWVGATLIDTTVVVYERTVRPLTLAERNRVIQEAAPFWALFGIPPEDCPMRWVDFRQYVDQRCVSLAPLVGETARKQVARLLEAQVSVLQPTLDLVRSVATELLPESLQNAFHLTLDAQQRLRARTCIFAAEQLLPRTPARLRFVPAYHRALHRLRRAHMQAA